MRAIEREPGKEYILSLSYGKDSLACLGAIEQLGWPLDRIVHAEVWATDTIPAEMPPMVEFKDKADGIIRSRWGLEVEHVRAARFGEDISYEWQFYQHAKCNEKRSRTYDQAIYGFPVMRGQWCTSRLKTDAIKKIHGKGVVTYIGIAADEPERIAKHTKTGKMLPLVEIGWDEAYCRRWCEENDQLSPIYTSATRGGSWFCHNQGVDQLRFLRKTYPEYWALMLKWDKDSPVTFKADGHTVHDYDARNAAEDAGLIDPEDRFRWEMIGRKIAKPRVELPGQMRMEELLNEDLGGL